MFPMSDVIPSRTTPYVTIGLIALNTLAFLHELRLSDPELERFIQRFGIVPASFSWVTVLTSMFLHAGWLHFLGNMLYLWIFGDNVEDRLGRARFLAFYVLCGAAGAAAQAATQPDSSVPMIGASGAIAGVMGAYFMMFPQSRVLTAIVLIFFVDLIEVPAILFLGIWFFMQLFSGLGSLGTGAAEGAVAFWAHVAGFVAGGGVGAVLRFAERRRPATGWNVRGD
jgi:membrane associated rhomboid family serine protease